MRSEAEIRARLRQIEEMRSQVGTPILKEKREVLRWVLNEEEKK